MPHVFHVNDTNMFHHGRTCLGVPKDDEHEVCEAVALVNLVLQSKKKRGKKKKNLVLQPGTGVTVARHECQHQATSGGATEEEI